MVLSLALHLAPLSFLLVAVPGAVSDGADGGDLVSAQAARQTQAMIVELVPDWTRPAPPPDVMAQAPRLAVPEPAPEERPPILPEPVLRSLPPLLARPELPQSAAVAEPDRAPENVLPPPPLADAAPPSADPLPETPQNTTAKAADGHLPEPDPPEAQNPERRADRKPASEAAPPAHQAPRAPSESRKAETAAGKGKNDAAGTGGNAEAATLSQSKVNDLKASWGARIRARIERRKEYPAKADGADGKVALSLVVGRDGRLISVSVSRSSGRAVLDQAALRAVERAGRFPAAPEELIDGSYAFALSIGFKK
ncbi:MAG: TonB family protein [Paracoccaceae bacterium]|nr:MAG: TonB family protein [Paracoccaceae bacterium]